MATSARCGYSFVSGDLVIAVSFKDTCTANEPVIIDGLRA